MSDLFHYILLALRLFTRKSEIKRNSDNVHWNELTNMKKLYARNNMFQKEFQIRDFETCIFWFKFCFLGGCFRALWPNFFSLASHGG